MRKRIFGKIIGFLLILFGIGVFFYPDISEYFLEQQTKQYIDEFQEKYKENRAKSSEGATEEETNEKSSEGSGASESSSMHETEALEPVSSIEKTNDPLYQEILKYNQEIYKNGQEGFRDAWSYQQAPVSLEGLEDGKFGYIEIPSMNVTLPLYIGASGTNMSKGAAVLGQTSIPVGGENSNSVIAAHRGWSTGSFLRDIEKVSVGDYIYITNPWECLAYQVEAIDIINPDDSDAVKIQEGKDMVTICTCHPYMSHGKYRYLLYCVRDKDKVKTERSQESISSQAAREDSEETNETAEGNGSYEGYIIASDGTVYESSGDTIQTENLLRRGSALVIILIVFVSFVYTKIRDKKN